MTDGWRGSTWDCKSQTCPGSTGLASGPGPFIVEAHVNSTSQNRFNTIYAVQTHYIYHLTPYDHIIYSHMIP